MSRGTERSALNKDVSPRPPVALDRARQPQPGKTSDAAQPGKNGNGEVKRVVHGRIVDVSPERVNQQLARIAREDFGQKPGIAEGRSREKVELSPQQIESTLARIANNDFGIKTPEIQTGAPREIAEVLKEIEGKQGKKPSATDTTGGPARKETTASTDHNVMNSAGDGSARGGDSTGGSGGTGDKKGGPGGGGADVPGGPVDPPGGGGGTRGGDAGDSRIPKYEAWKASLSEDVKETLGKRGEEMMTSLYSAMVVQLEGMGERDQQEFIDKQNDYFRLIISKSNREIKELFSGRAEDSAGNRVKFELHDQAFGNLLEMLPRQEDGKQASEIASKPANDVSDAEMRVMGDLSANTYKSLQGMANFYEQKGDHEKADGFREIANDFRKVMDGDKEAQKPSDLTDEAIMEKNKARASLLLYTAVIVNLLAAIRVPESAG